MEFQIRDTQFGLALYQADTAEEALADFLGDRMRGDVLAHHEKDADGTASFALFGRRYYAQAVADAPKA